MGDISYSEHHRGARAISRPPATLVPWMSQRRPWHFWDPTSGAKPVWACFRESLYMRVSEERRIPNCEQLVCCAGTLSAYKAESELSTIVHLFLLPGCGCNPRDPGPGLAQPHEL